MFSSKGLLITNWKERGLIDRGDGCQGALSSRFIWSTDGGHEEIQNVTPTAVAEREEFSNGRAEERRTIP